MNVRFAVVFASVLLLAAVPPRIGAAPPDEDALGDTPGTWVPTAEEIVQDGYAVFGLTESEDPTPAPPQGAPLTKASGSGLSTMRSDSRSKPVLLVHGRDQYNLDGWFAMRDLLVHQGFSAGVKVVGYYGGECMGPNYVSTLHHGSHNTWYGGTGEHTGDAGGKKGCDGGAHTQLHDLDTDFRHLAYHLAWTIYDHYTSQGVTVDVVGHSMGGLLIRYALAMVAKGDANWPPSLQVEDVVTLVTPHKGTISCGDFPWDDLEQMCRSSATMEWMKNNAQNPQGAGGTDWTLMGTECDAWLTTYNHLGMAAAHNVVYPDEWSGCYSHNSIYRDVSTTQDAKVFYKDAPDYTEYSWTAAPRSGQWTSYALFYGSW